MKNSNLATMNDADHRKHVKMSKKYVFVRILDHPFDFQFPPPGGVLRTMKDGEADFDDME